MARPKSEKTFANMLRVAISEAHGEGGTRLRAVADALVEKAMGGDVPAIKEVADRLDGKAMQAIEHSGEIETTSKEQRDAAVAAATRANA